MIEQATIGKIVDAANVVDVVNDFVNLRRRGANYMACCPFHEEKTPSFSVSPSKGIYKCFGCGKAGNSVTFVMEHEGLSYVEALRYLAKKYGIEIVEKEQTSEEILRKNDRESMMIISAYAQQFFAKNLHDTDEGKAIGLSYFKERAFSKNIVKKFELGYSPENRYALLNSAKEDGYLEEFLLKTGLCLETSTKQLIDRFSGRVIFPIHSLSGRVIAFGGRTLRTDKKVAKYLNSPESDIYLKRNSLYGIFFAKQSISRLDKCYLVEGYTDVISMYQSGIENVVASSGTSLTEEQIKLITRFSSNVTVLFDGDEAGIKASLRGIDMLLEQGVKTRIVLLPNQEDPDSFAKRHSQDQLREYLDTNEQDFLSFKIKLLLKDSENDPIKKSEVIKDVVKSIAIIPDIITRSVYLKESAKELDIEEEVLRTEIAKLRKERLTSIVKRQEADTKQDENKIEASPSIPTFVSNLFCEELEKELLRYILQDGRKKLFKADNDSDIYVDEYIIAELKNDDLEFQNLHYKQIFEEYDSLLNSDPEGDLSKYFFNHEDPKICNLTINLLSDKYELSKIWDNSKPLFRLQDAVPKTIASYKSKIVVMAIRNLMEKLNNTKGQEKQEIAEHLAVLHQQRKFFAEHLNRAILL